MDTDELSEKLSADEPSTVKTSAEHDIPSMSDAEYIAWTRQDFQKHYKAYEKVHQKNLVWVAELRVKAQERRETSIAEAPGSNVNMVEFSKWFDRFVETYDKLEFALESENARRMAGLDKMFTYCIEEIRHNKE